MSEAMASQLHVHLERPGFSLAVELAWDERVLVLFGPSGSGKTTLLEVVLGLHRSARARVRLAGEWIEDCERGLRKPPQQRGLGWVPQDPTLFPHLDVLENIRFGLGRVHPAADDPGASERTLERAIEVLELGHLTSRHASDLSGGERQRVALARAIASGPGALLLDEPLAALDIALRARVLPYLIRVRDELGLPMLYITHDPDEAMVMGERVAVFDAGRVVVSGSPREVLWSRAVAPLSRVLGVENVLDAVAIGTDGRVRTTDGLELAVPFPLTDGERIVLGLRAEDILLARDRPGRISARNIVEARVLRCEDRMRQVLVHLEAGPGGEALVAMLTPEAVRSLELAPGEPVYLVVKAQALRRVG